MKRTSLFVVLALIAAPLMAQSATLSITGSVNPGSSLSISGGGFGANDPVVAAISQSAGSTTLNLGPFGTLILDLASPVGFFPLGVADSNGNISLSFTTPAAPAGAPPIPSQDFVVQAVGIHFSLGGGSTPGLPGLSFCKSNTATLHVGP